MATIYKPLEHNVDSVAKFSIFLAGTIDMGNSEDWQAKLTKALSSYDIAIYNPRRDDWESSWKQEASCDQFRQQVCWEQQALHDASFRIFVFLGSSKSPITLLELGQFLNYPGAVCCEPEFYRRGNVEIVCKLANMPLFDTVEQLITHLKVILDRK